MYDGPLPAWLIAVASVMISIVGATPFSRSAETWRNIDDERILALLHRPIDLVERFQAAGRNSGGKRASIIWREAAESSSSTTATDAFRLP